MGMKLRTGWYVTTPGSNTTYFGDCWHWVRRHPAGTKVTRVKYLAAAPLPCWERECRGIDGEFTGRHSA